ncbi:hypothetical protein MAHJHV54_47590 [Mycobacterium avium subsp. hominissuis]
MVEVSSFVAAPLCGMTLSQLGAATKLDTSTTLRPCRGSRGSVISGDPLEDGGQGLAAVFERVA